MWFRSRHSRCMDAFALVHSGGVLYVYQDGTWWAAGPRGDEQPIRGPPVLQWVRSQHHCPQLVLPGTDVMRCACGAWRGRRRKSLPIAPGAGGDEPGWQHTTRCPTAAGWFLSDDSPKTGMAPGRWGAVSFAGWPLPTVGDLERRYKPKRPKPLRSCTETPTETRRRPPQQHRPRRLGRPPRPLLRLNEPRRDRHSDADRTATARRQTPHSDAYRDPHSDGDTDATATATETARRRRLTQHANRNTDAARRANPHGDTHATRPARTTIDFLPVIER